MRRAVLIGATAVAAVYAMQRSGNMRPLANEDARGNGGPARVASPAAPATSSVMTVRGTTVNGRPYTTFTAQAARVRLTLTRPDRTNTRVFLAVPGTYTSPQDRVEGFVVLDGRIVQMRERQAWDGAIVFRELGPTIIATDRGRTLTREWVRGIAASGASLIQAHLLVFDGVVQSFKPQPLLQRRALVTDEHGVPTIVESGQAVDLIMLAGDLVTFGARMAVNLDMGLWSEGWYRDPATGDTVTLGFPNAATARQTNWITFER